MTLRNKLELHVQGAGCTAAMQVTEEEEEDYLNRKGIGSVFMCHTLFLCIVGGVRTFNARKYNTGNEKNGRGGQPRVLVVIILLARGGLYTELRLSSVPFDHVMQ